MSTPADQSEIQRESIDGPVTRAQILQPPEASAVEYAPAQPLLAAYINEAYQPPEAGAVESTDAWLEEQKAHDAALAAEAEHQQVVLEQRLEQQPLVQEQASASAKDAILKAGLALDDPLAVQVHAALTSAFPESDAGDESE